MSVLDLLAAYPDREFSMAEIVRSTGINTASCHAVLNALTARGYLSRSPDEKRYTLGITLIAVGRVAAAAHPLIARAELAAKQLSVKIGASALVSTIVDDEILGLTVHTGLDGTWMGIGPGQRFPLAAPAGAHFLAWSSAEDVERWIARAGESSDEEIAHWRDALSLVRRRGYQVTLDVPVASEFSDLMAELALGQRSLTFSAQARELLTSHAWQLKQPETIDPEMRYDVSLIAAPIFDRDGKAVLSLGIGRFGRSITGLEIKAFADDLLQACVIVMTVDRSRVE